jgi:hypothetical protein
MAVEDMAMMGMVPSDAKMELEKEVAGVEMEEEGLFAEMAPKGQFSKGAINSLVSAHNAVTKLFDLPTYPAFESDVTEFPSNFVRELSMIAAAVSDAIAADVLTPEMEISLEGIKSDRELAPLSGRLQMISKSKDFKKFLAEPKEEEAAPEEAPEMAEEEMDVDALIMERM